MKWLTAVAVGLCFACSGTPSNPDEYPARVDGRLTIGSAPPEQFLQGMNILGGNKEISLQSEKNEAGFWLRLYFLPTLEEAPATYDFQALASRRDAPAAATLYVPHGNSTTGATIRSGTLTVSHAPSIAEPWLSAKLVGETNDEGTHYRIEGTINADLSVERMRSFRAP